MSFEKRNANGVILRRKSEKQKIVQRLKEKAKLLKEKQQRQLNDSPGTQLEFALIVDTPEKMSPSFEKPQKSVEELKSRAERAVRKFSQTSLENPHYITSKKSGPR